MAVSVLLASVVLAQAPMANPIDVAYAELRADNAAAAIAKIERSDARGENHPAALINLGIAYARVGRTADARTMFEAAVASDERCRLETSSGVWMDSRDLARRALVMLDKGEFSSAQLAAR